jgi:hypothetical protein
MDELKIKKLTEPVMFTIRVDKSIVDFYDDLARRTNRSRNELIGLALDFAKDKIIVESWLLMYCRIRDLREDHDLLQKDIAAYLKCTQVCYSNYEMGKRDIPTDVLKALALFYDTSVDYLLGLTDEAKPYPRSH